MMDQYTLCNRVKALRTRLGLSQSQLAREIGVTRQTVLAIEKSKLTPSISLSLKLARVLREPVDYVFYLTPKDAAVSPLHAVPDQQPEDPTIDKQRDEATGNATKPASGLWDFV